MKKLASLLLIPGLAVSLVGCGSELETESGQDSPSESEFSTSSHSSEHSSSSRDYSSSDDYSGYKSGDDDNDRSSSSGSRGYYDEESGIYGVTEDDGSGVFAGEDFAARINEDGTAVATDGKGNWAKDTDGDGQADSISVDDGETWEDIN